MVTLLGRDEGGKFIYIHLLHKCAACLNLDKYIAVISVIIIRKGEIVWKAVWIEYYLRLNLVSKDTSTEAASEYIKCKQRMCREIKTIIFFM